MSSVNSIHRGAWPRSFESLVGELVKGLDGAALRPVATDHTFDIEHRCLVVHDQVDIVIARACDLRQSRRQRLWRVARLFSSKKATLFGRFELPVVITNISAAF